MVPCQWLGHQHQVCVPSKFGLVGKWSPACLDETERRIVCGQFFSQVHYFHVERAAPGSDAMLFDSGYQSASEPILLRRRIDREHREMPSTIMNVHEYRGRQRAVAASVDHKEARVRISKKRGNLLCLRPVAVDEEILDAIGEVDHAHDLGDVALRRRTRLHGLSFLSKNSATAAFTRRLFR